MALRKPGSSQEFMERRSTTAGREKYRATAARCAAEISVSTAVSTAGTWNSFATFARSVVLLMMSTVRAAHAEGHLCGNKHDGEIRRRVEFIVLVHILFPFFALLFVVGYVYQSNQQQKMRTFSRRERIPFSSFNEAPSPAESLVPFQSRSPSISWTHA